jgi:hypothetical protein
MTSQEADIAVLKRDVAELRADIEKQERLTDERRKLDDARHEAVMSQLGQLQLTIASGAAFNKGITTTVKAAWGAMGVTLGGVLSWFLQGGFK